MTDIIAGRKAIGKFFYQYGFGENLSSIPQKRLTEIICGLAMKGNQSRTTDFAELNQGFRTTYGYFLSKGMGGHEYWIHRYEGALNGIEKAVVLLSYPKDAFGSNKALRVFLCSDFGLSDALLPLSAAIRRFRTLLCSF